LSTTIFGKTPILQALLDAQRQFQLPYVDNQLNLFSF
jgi:hypothetical protein